LQYQIQEYAPLTNSQIDKARAEAAKAEGKLEQYSKDAKKEVDAFDRAVEKKASEAKSGFSSWFGGK